MTEQHALVQAELRVRVIELVRDVDPAVLDRPAAATPGWRVRDVLAHMVGVSDDVVNGRLDGIASDEWTGAQVERRRNISIAELLGDWEHYGPEFEKLLAGAPEEIAGQAIFDAATHEHDVRQAIGRPGARQRRHGPELAVAREHPDARGRARDPLRHGAQRRHRGRGRAAGDRSRAPLRAAARNDRPPQRGRDRKLRMGARA